MSRLQLVQKKNYKLQTNHERETNKMNQRRIELVFSFCLFFLILAAIFVNQTNFAKILPSFEDNNKGTTMAACASSNGVFKMVLKSTEKQGNVFKYEIWRKTALTWGMFAKEIQENEELQDLLSKTISSSPFQGLFFETAPTTVNTKDSDLFQFVLVNSKTLGDLKSADFASFSRFFDKNEKAVTFPNLGRDAVLVCPVPDEGLNQETYIHAANFFRGTETRPELSRAIWSNIGLALNDWFETSERTVWLSTSGLGVYFLHFRLDTIPKYYTYSEFRTK